MSVIAASFLHALEYDEEKTRAQIFDDAVQDALGWVNITSIAYLSYCFSQNTEGAAVSVEEATKCLPNVAVAERIFVSEQKRVANERMGLSAEEAAFLASEFDELDKLDMQVRTALSVNRDRHVHGDALFLLPGVLGGK